MEPAALPSRSISPPSASTASSLHTLCYHRQLCKPGDNQCCWKWDFGLQYQRPSTGCHPATRRTTCYFWDDEHEDHMLDKVGTPIIMCLYKVIRYQSLPYTTFSNLCILPPAVLIYSFPALQWSTVCSILKVYLLNQYFQWVWVPVKCAVVAVTLIMLELKFTRQKKDCQKGKKYLASILSHEKSHLWSSSADSGWPMSRFAKQVSPIQVTVQCQCEASKLFSTQWGIGFLHH